MKRILSVLSLLVFCSSVALAGAPARPQKGARRIARPAASQVQPTFGQRLWKNFTGWIRTFEGEEDPPPPPDRILSPVPG